MSGELSFSASLLPLRLFTNIAHEGGLVRRSSQRRGHRYCIWTGDWRIAIRSNLKLRGLSKLTVMPFLDFPR